MGVGVGLPYGCTLVVVTLVRWGVLLPKIVTVTNPTDRVLLVLFVCLKLSQNNNKNLSGVRHGRRGGITDVDPTLRGW